MTSTVSGRMSSSRSTSFTRRLPDTSTSRRGLRRTTFMSALASALRKSGCVFDVADLRQVDAIVSLLQHPPLRQIQIAEPQMLEHETARIDRRELVDRRPAPFTR